MQYKNVSGQELTVIGVGIVPADGTVEIEGEFRSPNFREVTAPPTEQANQKLTMAEWVSNLGYMAMVKEVTPGTVPSTPNVYVPLFDENIQFLMGLTEDNSAIGSKAKTYQVLPGRHSYSGDVTVVAEPNTAAHIANMLLTQGSSSGSGPYTYPFTLSATNPKSYTIDLAKGPVVHRYMGVQASDLSISFKDNEMQFKVKVSALNAFVQRDIASISTTVLTLATGFSDFNSTSPTTGLVAGDTVSIISATGGVATLNTTVASLTATTVTLSASAAAFSAGDTIVIRPATAPSLATVTPFLWSRTEFRFGATASAALTATHTPLEASSMWSVTHDFNNKDGEWRSGSPNPASLARKTGDYTFKAKQYFDVPNANVSNFQKAGKVACVVRHFSETGYEFRLTMNNFKWKTVVPQFKVGDLLYSEMDAVPQYDGSDGQMFSVTVINNLASV